VSAGFGGEFAPGGDAELGQGVRDVRLDGSPRDKHPLGDRGVGEALGDQADSLQFGVGEGLPAVVEPAPCARDPQPARARA
jgi:hypothetical protein